MPKTPFQRLLALRSLVVGSTLSFALLCSSQTSRACYVDGQVTATSVEGTATTLALPNAKPQAIQPATIRTRAGSTYTVSSVVGYWYGTRQSVDRLGVSRSVAQRYPNNQYGSAVSVTVPPADSLSQNGLPAPTASTATRQYGPYTPVNSYGVEYIYLNLIDTWGTFWLPEITHNPIVTNTNPGYAVAVYVYPNNAQALFYDNVGAALNGETVQGNAPKIQVKMSNLYPAGVTSIQFYKGPQTNSPSLLTSIPVTQATAKSTDLDARNVNVDLSTLILTPGVWTIEAVQRTTAYPDDHIGSATITIINNININTDIGTLK
jgi:hypothetical protein